MPPHAPERQEPFEFDKISSPLQIIRTVGRPGLVHILHAFYGPGVTDLTPQGPPGIVH